jgi:hypothetical protein
VATISIFNGPDTCVIIFSTVTCSGNQTFGITSGSDFLAPPITQLEVTNLSANIAPPSGTNGISFTSASDVFINFKSRLFNVTASGSDIHGISGSSSGGLVNVTNSGDIFVSGHNAIGIFASAGSAGATVITTGNVIANGDGADAIFVQSVGGKSSVSVLGGNVNGGTGTGYGVAFKNGIDHTLTNYGVISALSGTAVLSNAGFDHKINNYGTISGNVILFGYGSSEVLGTNSFSNALTGEETLMIVTRTLNRVSPINKKMVLLILALMIGLPCLL